jgi:hypothetical protein
MHDALILPGAHGDAESDHPAEIIGIHVRYGLPTQRRNRHGHALLLQDVTWFREAGD